MPFISVLLVYSPEARKVLEISLQLEDGSTVSNAIQSSNVLQNLSQSDIETLEVGVWGKKVELNHLLKDGDRVELYRPLTVDPKVARRERFARQGARTAGLFAKRRAGAKPGY
jgi:putative ubiquitin-RnfH superfamily antitoxin RatB of RatAB toxin-antitoxin module